MVHKLNPNANFDHFLETVQACKGRVRFRTVEGDLLDLQSSISQYVFIAVVAGKLHNLDGWLEVEEAQDVELLADYIGE